MDTEAAGVREEEAPEQEPDQPPKRPREEKEAGAGETAKPAQRRRRAAEKQEDEGDDGVCPVCCNKFTLAARARVPCAKCQVVACRACYATYITTSAEPACCVSCRAPMDRKVLGRCMTKKFMATEYKEHREAMLFDRERSMLPTAYPHLRARARRDILTARRAELNILFARINQVSYLLDRRMTEETAFISNYTARDPGPLYKSSVLFTSLFRGNGSERYQDLTGLLSSRDLKVSAGVLEKARPRRTEGAQGAAAAPGARGAAGAGGEDEDEGAALEAAGAPGKKKEEEEKKPKYLTRGHCPKPDCRGFIDEGWSCLVCSTKVCRTCMVRLEEGHECREEDVLSVEEIRKSCKPCPKCRVRVFRVSGCLQMWCTSCQTAFDWNSLQIVRRGIHNPHYMEWVASRRTVGGTRGHGCVSGASLSQAFRRLGIIPDAGDDLFSSTSQAFLGFLQRANHITDYETDPGDARNLQSNAYVRLRCSYLLNEISEQEFKVRIQRQDKADSKKVELCQIKDTYANVVRDILTKLQDTLNQIADTLPARRDPPVFDALSRHFTRKRWFVLFPNWRLEAAMDFMNEHGVGGAERDAMIAMRAALAELNEITAHTDASLGDVAKWYGTTCRDGRLLARWSDATAAREMLRTLIDCSAVTGSA